MARTFLGGRGRRRRRKGGFRFSIENPRRGGGLPGEGARGRGLWRVSAGNFWGEGGAKYFLGGGGKIHTKIQM